MKKELPLIFIKKFKPSYKENIKVIQPKTEDDEFIILFQDKDPESSLFFRVDSYQPGRNDYVITYKPVNENSVVWQSMNVKAEQIDAHYNKWLNMVRQYDESESLFDDPIVRGHAENYFSDFEIVEDDESHKTLTAKQIIYLEDKLETFIDDIENIRDDDNGAMVEEIKENTRELIQQLPRESKLNILKRVSLIWAKSLKNFGTKFIKVVLDEAKKRSITQAFDKTIELIDQIKDIS